MHITVFLVVAVVAVSLAVGFLLGIAACDAIDARHLKRDLT